MDPIKENTDLNQQYQEILDRYAKELKTPDPDVIKSETNPQDNISLPPMPSALPSTTPTSAVIPASNPIFKYFFYLSLLIFLGVVGSIIYSMTQNSSNSNAALKPTPIPLPTIASEDVNAKYCETNDKKVMVGDSFSAADGCNICTCNDDQTIKCTENVCTTTIIPTITSTDTVKLTPTIATSPLDVATNYLQAYVTSDWSSVKTYLDDNKFDEKIASSYNFTSFKITSSKYDKDKNYFHVYLNLTDKNGQEYKVSPPNTPLEVLMRKTDNGWKAITWYFLP